MKMLTKYFGWIDIVLVILLALSLTYCNGSPGVVKPETKYLVSLDEGFVFSRPGSPDFIKKMIGLAGREDWGRWSDQDAVILEFTRPLPKSFILELQAKGFGPNVGKATKIIIGKDAHIIQLSADTQTFSVPIDAAESVSQIQIIPPAPTSPNALNSGNPDTRNLGIGLVSMKLVNRPKNTNNN
jgi:phosphoglycerol transferase